MTIKELLISYKGLYYDAKRFEDDYKKLHYSIGGGAINYTDMPKGNNISSPTERDAIRLADAYLEYMEAFNNATARMLEIESLINKASDYRGRYVLHEHYIKFRSLDAIGLDDAVDRCGRQVRRYHDMAIMELENESKKTSRSSMLQGTIDGDCRAGD